MFRSIIFVAFLCSCVTTSEIKSSGEANAKEWCQEMNVDCTGYSCSGSDSDDDGYTSCTVATAEGNRIALNCGRTIPLAIFGQNHGCKEAAVRTIQTPDLGQ